MITDGSRVTGTYCNVPFSGIVTNERRNTRTGKAEYSVTLDAPIVVLGDARTSVICILGERYLPCTIALA